MGQFGLLAQMQDDLDADYPHLSIDILSINKIGSTVPSSWDMSLDLPVVQNDSSMDIWTAWGGAWRDVFILDQNNEIFATFNLSQNNLNVPSNYSALMQLFVDAATQ